MTTSAPAGYRLVRPAAVETVVPQLDAAQQHVVHHRGGPLLVLAGPGTGKTTTVVESVVDRVRRDGVDPESVLVLTFSRRAAAELRERVTARLGAATREPVARTFHSYAFGLLRREAARRGDPPPRLLSGAEQDVVVRELLAGAGADRWPAHVRPALATRGFAQELRDLLLRAYERGLGVDGLADLGRRHDRPEWVAAASFLAEYTEVTALRDPSAYDPAELIRAVVDLWRSDPELLAAERAARTAVFVDELQDTDPAQVELLELLAGGGTDLVAVGDPDQSIYGFRGADPRAVRDFSERFRHADGRAAEVVALSTCRRSGAQLLAASRRVADRLGSVPGGARHRVLQAAPGGPDGSVTVAVFRSQSAEAAWVAGRLREAHLRDGVPWSRMAALVRSTAASGPVLRRALAGAGVPVELRTEELSLSGHPAVRPLLLLLSCAAHPQRLDEAAAEELLGSPLGGADVLTLRRLRRELRRLELAGGGGRASSALLAEAIEDPRVLATLDERAVRPAARVGQLVEVARTALAAPAATVETVLWAVWSATGLSRRWERLSAAGGSAGAAADRDLDGVVALFDAAARFVDRLPGARLEVFLDAVLDQDVPTDTLAPRTPERDAVHLMTAHASKGLEWDVVCVAGVQEGSWPDLRARGSFLGSERLVDLVDAGADALTGPAATVATLTRLLGEERRLFYVAATRARRRLLVSAVASEREGLQPGRFLDELDPLPPEVELRPVTVPERPMSLSALVGELRQSVTVADDRGAGTAAAHLARLADAGVGGADPATWWGLARPSDDRPVLDPDEPVVVSPSKVEAFGRCELRWFLESAGGSDPPGAAQRVGNAVHAVADAAPPGAGDEELLRLLEDALRAVDIGRGWVAGQEQARAEVMVRRLGRWLRENPRTLVGSELDFTAEVGRAVVRGRVDRLERDADGAAVVVDLKTGGTRPRDDEMLEHAQLATYQVAVERGAFADRGLARSGGAELVQLGTAGHKDAARVQRQHALAASEDPQWAERMVRSVAERMAASTFQAMENRHCDRCPVRSSCPARDEGRQVTS